MEKKEGSKKKGFWKTTWGMVSDTFTGKEAQPETKATHKDDKKVVNLARFCVKFYENSIVVIKRNEENALEFAKNYSSNNADDAKVITKQDIDSKTEKLVAQHGYSALLGVVNLEGYKF